MQPKKWRVTLQWVENLHKPWPTLRSRAFEVIGCTSDEAIQAAKSAHHTRYGDKWGLTVSMFWPMWPVEYAEGV